MKRLPVILICCVMLVGAYATNFLKRESISRSEDWVAQQCPTTVGKYRMMDSYKMDQLVYDTLAPFGIVCHHYTDGRKIFDVVVIASASPKSFHDPRICFSSQGLELMEEKNIVIHSKTHGEVPMTLVKIKENGLDLYSAYTYKGPSGMIATPKGLMKDLFLTSLKKFHTQEGVFLRFIAKYPAPTEKELSEFITEYLDAASASSNGYL
ncbi:MAG: exosortase-associated EpsI family protein [Armatimonadetes bacterium]|nr:exosortase-associated EpsI family protein [Armatimonadota bacterium]